MNNTKLIKKLQIICEKSDPYINRHSISNNFIRADELIPDYDENEILEGNKLLRLNYLNPNFLFDISNIKKGFDGIYPFNFILSMSSKKERELLYLIYEKELDIPEIAKQWKVNTSYIRKLSGHAHSNFTKHLIQFSKMQITINKLGGV